MNARTKLLLALSAGVLLAAALPALAQTPAPAPARAEPAAVLDVPSLARAASGKQDYDRYCVWCHGSYGDGHGISSRFLGTPPRDLSVGVYRCRTTPTGSLPTNSDLRRTIRSGVHGTQMPAWSSLSNRQLDDVVAYIETLSDRFSTEPRGTVVVVPAEPATTNESVARGGEVYTKMKCFTCHGKALRGHGPGAGSLKDDFGNSLEAPDLTQRGAKKCGDTPERLFVTLHTGLDGTPMPSYADTLSPDETWDLVHFILAREH